MNTESLNAALEQLTAKFTPEGFVEEIVRVLKAPNLCEILDRLYVSGHIPVRFMVMTFPVQRVEEVDVTASGNTLQERDDFEVIAMRSRETSDLAVTNPNNGFGTSHRAEEIDVRRELPSNFTAQTSFCNEQLSLFTCNTVKPHGELRRDRTVYHTGANLQVSDRHPVQEEAECDNTAQKTPLSVILETDEPSSNTP